MGDVSTVCRVHHAGIAYVLAPAVPVGTVDPVTDKPVRRVPASFRLRPEVLDRLRQCIRDNSGRPLYLETGPFIEKALEAAMDQVERELAERASTPPRVTALTTMPLSCDPNHDARHPTRRT